MKMQRAPQVLMARYLRRFNTIQYRIIRDRNLYIWRIKPVCVCVGGICGWPSTSTSISHIFNPPHQSCLIYAFVVTCVHVGHRLHGVCVCVCVCVWVKTVERFDVLHLFHIFHCLNIIIIHRLARILFKSVNPYFCICDCVCVCVRVCVCVCVCVWEIAWSCDSLTFLFNNFPERVSSPVWRWSSCPRSSTTFIAASQLARDDCSRVSHQPLCSRSPQVNSIGVCVRDAKHVSTYTALQYSTFSPRVHAPPTLLILIQRHTGSSSRPSCHRNLVLPLRLHTLPPSSLPSSLTSFTVNLDWHKH